MSWLPVLLLFALVALQRTTSEERRTDVMRAVLSGPAEPGFWPSRGRRGGGSAEGSPEEQPPPFWAHRGREGESRPPCQPPLAASLFAQEPKYLLVHRGETDDSSQPLWISRAAKRSEQ